MEMIAKDFKQQGVLIEDTFKIIDECIDLFNEKATDDDFHRICGLVLAKARNFALGSYGLILDGLGQESGALLRPFIEYHELLTYFRLEPSRINEAINNCLPSAGKRALKIAGQFSDFRKYLNEHASHSSLSNYSLNHVFEKSEKKILKVQPMRPNVLFQNMGDFFVQLLLISIEAVNCLQTANMGSADSQANTIEQLRVNGFILFKLDERKEK